MAELLNSGPDSDLRLPRCISGSSITLGPSHEPSTFPKLAPQKSSSFFEVGLLPGSMRYLRGPQAMNDIASKNTAQLTRPTVRPHVGVELDGVTESASAFREVGSNEG